MSTEETSTLAPETPETTDRESNVRVLGAQEIRRTWRSYAATAVGNVFIGLFAASLFWTVVSLDAEGQRFGVPNFETDLSFFILMSLLSLNWVSRNYATVWEDPFSKWMGFLRTLPVPVRDIVTARALIMVGATVSMSGMFFLPFYLLHSRLDPRLTGLVPPLDYLWFIGVWSGYALLIGGLNLYLELGLRGKMMLLAQIITVVALLVMVIVLTALDVHLVLASFRLVEDYGPLPALAAVAIGLSGMMIGQRATARRLKTRSLTS